MGNADMHIKVSKYFKMNYQNKYMTHKKQLEKMRKQTLSLVGIVICFAAFLFLGGCAISPQVNFQAEPIEDLSHSEQKNSRLFDAGNQYQQRYRLSIGDQIEVRYLRQLQFSTTVTVGPDGTISLPFLSSVAAQGKTIDELHDLLEQQYIEFGNSGPPPNSKQYMIGVGDVLEVKFPFLDEYSETVTVRPDGKISLPLIDSVIVEGKSPEDIEAELIHYYKQHLDKTVLVVNVVSSASNLVVTNGKRRRVPLTGLDSLYLTLKTKVIPKVYVAGEVVHPAAIPYEPTLSSLQAIIAAGGITDDAELKNVIIVRKGISESPRYIVRNLLADIEGEVIHNENSRDDISKKAVPILSSTNDIFLQPFDVVIVPKTIIANVQSVLDRYVYNLFPPLGNAAFGFTFSKQVGTQKVKQETTIVP